MKGCGWGNGREQMELRESLVMTGLGTWGGAWGRLGFQRARAEVTPGHL